MIVEWIIFIIMLAQAIYLGLWIVPILRMNTSYKIPLYPGATFIHLIGVGSILIMAFIVAGVILVGQT
jgi:type IV secretory pathway TrbL component